VHDGIAMIRVLSEAVANCRVAYAMAAEEERLRCVTAAVAVLMGVQRYTLTIPTHSGESSVPGAAST
jgi:hypothetical protein